MNIESISATNFKNLALNNVPLRRVTLVMGENSVGKSNLLQLIHTVFSKKEPLGGAGVQFPLDGLVDDSDLVKRGADSGTATVCVSTDSSRFRDALKAFGKTFTEPYTKKATLEFEFHRQPKGCSFSLTKLTLGTTLVHSEAMKGPKIPPDALAKLQEWISAELVDSTVYIPTNRFPSRSGVQFSTAEKVDAVTNLENTVLRLLSDPRADPTIIDEIRSTLSDFFGIVDIRSTLEVESVRQGTEFLPPPGGIVGAQSRQRPVTDIRLGVRVREENREWFELERVGSGLLQVLVMITVLIQHKARIVLIEEFDSSLSPKNRRALFDHFVRLATPGGLLSQLIATTHGAFRFADPRPMALAPKPIADGKVEFAPANKKFWKDYTLVEHKS
jgi:predicted ATPase